MEFFCERIQEHTERNDCQNCDEHQDCVEAGYLTVIDRKLKPQLPKPKDHETQSYSKNEPTGSVEWVQNQLFHRWQVVRRHPEYVEFCRGRNFTDAGPLDVWEMSNEPKAEEVMQKLGLELIYDPAVDIPKENLIEFPIFKDAFAVSYEWTTDDEGVRTPLWHDQFIKLKIDITKKLNHIEAEVREFVEEARRLAQIKEPKFRLRQRDEAYKVWDLKSQGTKPKEIIAELWPDEWEKAVFGADNTDADNCYKELCTCYQEQGVEDWQERAFNEAYGNTSDAKTIQALYMRVNERLNVMKEEFEKVIIKE